MRRKIAAHGEEGLDELPREALRRWQPTRRRASVAHAAGGDAG